MYDIILSPQVMSRLVFIIKASQLLEKTDKHQTDLAVEDDWTKNNYFGTTVSINTI